MSQITGWLIILAVIGCIWGGYLLLRPRGNKSHAQTVTVNGKEVPAKKDPKNDLMKSHNGHGHDKEGTFTKFTRGFASFLGILAVMLIFGVIVWAVFLGTKRDAHVPSPSTKPVKAKVVALPKGIKMCATFDTNLGNRVACLANDQRAVLIPEGVYGDITCWGSSFDSNELQVVLEDGSTVEGFDDTKLDQKAVAFILNPPPGKTRFYIYWLLAPDTPGPKPCHITS